MGKVLKKVGTIVTIGAAVAFTGGLGAFAGLGVGLGEAAGIVAGASFLGTGISVSTLFIAGAVLSTVGAAIAGAGSLKLEDTGANARGQAFTDPNMLGAFVFGETSVPMGLVFQQNHGADNEFVSSVHAHAWHEIDGYVSLTIDGELVSFAGDAATGAYAGIVSWIRRTGTQAQSAITLAGTTWPATAKGAGFAHSALVWNFKDQDKLKGGVPTALVGRVRGAKLYDPRLDSTAGGAGTQRYADPSTWTYNDGNAALVALRYLIGERSSAGRLLWGVGEDQTDVDLSSFIASANVADEVRDGVPRYRLAGFYATSNDHQGFFTQWELNTGGKIARIGGKRFCWLPQNDLTSIATLTDKNLVAGAGVKMNIAGDPRNLINTVRGRYISADDLFQGAPYPEVEEAAFVAEDGGRRRILEMDFGWLQDKETAERVARQAIRRKRFDKTWFVAVGAEGVLYPPFSILTINLQETSDADQLVRVVDVGLTPEGAHFLALQEEDASIYDDTPLLGAAPAQLAAPATLPQSGTVLPRYKDGTRIDTLKPAEGGADATAGKQAASITGQGALATKNSVDLATTEVANKSALNIAESASRKWAGESGADITGGKTSADTTRVGGTLSATVRDNAQTGFNLTGNNSTVLDRSSIDDILFRADPGFVMSEGANERRVTNALLANSGRDGDAFTYNPTFGVPPKVIWGTGGLTYDPGLNTTIKEFYTIRNALNATVSGFTSQLLLKERTTGTITPRSLNVSGTGLTRDTADKGHNDSGATATIDDKYTLNYTVRLTGTGTVEPIESSAQVQFWENSTGSFALRGSRSHIGPGFTGQFTDFTNAIVVTLNGIDALDNFRITVVQQFPIVAIIGTPNFQWSTGDTTAAAQVTATPSGVADVPVTVIANEDTGQFL